MRFILHAATCTALLLSGEVMTNGEPPKGNNALTSAILTVEGPGGARLIFSGPTQGLYRKVEALLPGRSAVEITLSAGSPPGQTLVDGPDAEGENGMPDIKLRKGLPWSLGLWSLDGNYVVLKSYETINGQVEERDSGDKEAYDTRTGEMVEFVGKTMTLDRFSFDHWSPIKPAVAILITGMGPPRDLEEAYLRK